LSPSSPSCWRPGTARSACSGLSSRAHFGGPAAWGTITVAESLGLIAGGLMSLRFSPRRPMLFVVLIGASIGLSPLAMAMLLPLPAICVTSFVLGIALEIMMVQWTVALARNVPPDMLARVSSYDAFGSVMAMPIGAVLAGPIAAWAGVSATQYGAAALIVLVSVFALIPRDIRTLRAEHLAGPAEPETVAAVTAVPGGVLPVGGDEPVMAAASTAP
jgi:MFS family permease